MGYLIVTVIGEGTVVSADRQIQCGAACLGRYTAGTRVELSAEPASGWVFEGWDGDDDCIDGGVTIPLERRCIARFTRERHLQHSLEIAIEGGGTVFFPDLGRSSGCDAHCIRGFDPGTDVRLGALPRPGWLFSRFTGDDDCRDGVVTMDGYRRCVGEFGLDPDAQVSLHVELDGPGTVTFNGPLPVPACKQTCVRTFPIESQVVLSIEGDRERDTRFAFAAGDPGCAERDVVLDRPKRCSVHFNGGRHILWMRTSAGGSVRIDPAGATCSTEEDEEPCGFPVYDGGRVKAVPVPEEGFELDRWLGDCGLATTSATGEVELTLERNLSCKAVFRLSTRACAPGTDTVAPEPPRSVRASAEDCLAAIVSWDEARDGAGCGVTGYRVFRNGRELSRETAASRAAYDLRWLHPGSTHRYSVVAVDGAGNVSAPSAEAVVTLPACDPYPSVMRVAVILARFAEQPFEPFTAEAAERVMFSPLGSLSAFVEEMSYGGMRLEGEVHGWYVLPQATGAYCSGLDDRGSGVGCDYHALRADVARLADADIDFSRFDRVVIVYHDVVDWAGLAGGVMDTDEATVHPLMEIAARDGFTLHTLSHELGHTLNTALHAALWSCDGGPVGSDHRDPLAGGCRVITYGDPIDPMGGGINHFSAYNKLRMGFFGRDRVALAERPGVYEISRLAADDSGPRALVIPLDDGAGLDGDGWFIEYRAPIGWDTLTRRGDRLRALVVRLATAFQGSSSANTLFPEENAIVTPGAPFYDPYRGLLVELLATGDQRARVRVSHLE